MTSVKQNRIAEQIRIILSELFLREMRDPRLEGLTVTDVSVDREIQYADIYVHALGMDDREEEVMVALEGAKGYLRREVGAALQVRSVPELRFHWDPTLQHAEHIDRLIDELDIPEAPADDAESPE